MSPLKISPAPRTIEVMAVAKTPEPEVVEDVVAEIVEVLPVVMPIPPLLVARPVPPVPVEPVEEEVKVMEKAKKEVTAPVPEVPVPVTDTIKPSVVLESVKPADVVDIRPPPPPKSADDNDENDKHAIVPAPAEKEIRKPATPTTTSTPAGKTQPTSSKDLIPVLNPGLFSRIPKGHVLRCKVIRKVTLLDKAHPIYSVINETDDKFLMAGRKRKKTKSVNFLISSSPDELTKESKHYVGKLAANFQRTQFILYDSRLYNKVAPGKGLKELVCVNYVRTPHFHFLL